MRDIAFASASSPDLYIVFRTVKDYFLGFPSLRCLDTLVQACRVSALKIWRIHFYREHHRPNNATGGEKQGKKEVPSFSPLSLLYPTFTRRVRPSPNASPQRKKSCDKALNRLSAITFSSLCHSLIRHLPFAICHLPSPLNPSCAPPKRDGEGGIGIAALYIWSIHPCDNSDPFIPSIPNQPNILIHTRSETKTETAVRFATVVSWQGNHNHGLDSHRQEFTWRPRDARQVPSGPIDRGGRNNTSIVDRSSCR